MRRNKNKELLLQSMLPDDVYIGTSKVGTKNEYCFLGLHNVNSAYVYEFIEDFNNNKIIQESVNKHIENLYKQKELLKII